MADDKRTNLKIRVEVTDSNDDSLMSESSHVWYDVPYAASVRLEDKIVDAMSLVLKEGVKMGYEVVKMQNLPSFTVPPEKKE